MSSETQSAGESETVKSLGWWVVNRKWIVGVGVGVLVLRLLMAGYTHHSNQVQEQDRFVPTPTTNVLLDRKTLRECWAGEVAYTTPKEVTQELQEATEGLRRAKRGTPQADAAERAVE